MYGNACLESTGKKKPKTQEAKAQPLFTPILARGVVQRCHPPGEIAQHGCGGVEIDVISWAVLLPLT
jgi:hypothetical protein